MSYLDSITSEELRGLSEPELLDLCREIRTVLVRSVSRTGGHLASNLGAVELTVAIHRVFDTARDRLVFDVGHQCYVHKLLTGRAAEFSTLRTCGGISGFPKPRESVHDAYVAGHASTSISVALGMARAVALSGGTERIICLIGDGAMTGGTAYEGLCDLASSGLPVIVILNDNGMSINPNTGGLGNYLKRLRLKHSYLVFKKRYRAFMQKVPGGRAVYRITHRMKERLKRSVLNESMFEQLGMAYSGPVDGHDVGAMEEVLRWAADQGCPTMVHAITKKGMGYPFAEADPGKFHGIGPFDPDTGEPASAAVDFSAVFGNEMMMLAEKDPAVCAITAAMTEGTGLGGFAALYPDRFYDVGIAEEHAAAMAGGLAACGMKPVFAVYSTFLQRSYDMLVQELALAGQHVLLAVDRAGLVGADGETHQGLLDVAYLSSIPGMTVFSPASFAELRSALHEALYDTEGPVAVRYPRGGEGEYADCSEGPAVRLRNGKRRVILTYGVLVNECLIACDRLNEEGLETGLVKLNRICPLPEKEILDLLEGCEILLCAEEAEESGGIGMRVAAMLERNGAPLKALSANTGNGFVTHGSVPELRRLCGLDAESLAERMKEADHG
ncbi:MAG: 1-deoxy-D-xylulose-5-phosphate synthase [Oscillospiraceae bacterium]|nr:1-deoxy-D-xylulose-5-phosphate synthase [Oscillospiraceae bacterium]